MGRKRNTERDCGILIDSYNGMSKEQLAAKYECTVAAVQGVLHKSNDSYIGKLSKETVNAVYMAYRSARKPDLQRIAEDTGVDKVICVAILINTGIYKRTSTVQVKPRTAVSDPELEYLYTQQPYKIYRSLLRYLMSMGYSNAQSLVKYRDRINESLHSACERNLFDSLLKKLS